MSIAKITGSLLGKGIRGEPPIMPKFRNAALLAVSLAAIALFLTLDGREWNWLFLAAKLVPVASLLAWLSPPQGRYGRLVFAGLVLSLAGDAFLALPGDWFMPGLVAFLFAHLCYIAAFVGQRPRLELVRILPFLAWIGGLYGYLFPDLGAMAVPVGVYSLVIGTMMWRASALVTRPVDRRQLTAALGALLFGLSDSTLALMRFHGALPFGGVFLILAYWGGQAGIAASVKR